MGPNKPDKCQRNTQSLYRSITGSGPGEYRAPIKICTELAGRNLIKYPDIQELILRNAGHGSISPAALHSGPMLELGPVLIERRNRLHTIKPTSGRLALPPDNGFYPVIFLGDVPDKYGLVVCNAVSKFTDFEHLIMCFMTQLLHRFTGIGVRKNSSKMRIPKIVVMRSCQHGFPKYKFQLGNHFARGRLHPAYI